MSKFFPNQKDFVNLVNNTKGAKIVVEKNNVYLIRVKTYKACNRLFDRPDIHWCIATSEGQWRSYVDKPFRKQYFIVDFNNIFSNDKFVADEALIGFTMSGPSLIAAHTKNDNAIMSRFNDILTNKGILEETTAELDKFVQIFFIATALSVVSLICWLVKLIFF